MSNPPPSRFTGWRPWVALFGGQLALLLVAAARNTDQLNTDGIAYLRLAHYYAHGPLPLAVSGYWGPLLSWLLAPLLAAGVAPLIAARMVMAGTAMVYLAGGAAFLRALGLPRPATLAGSALAALAAVAWSVEFISPDLLVAGLMLLALAVWLKANADGANRRALLAGGLWGVAYLAKAVALPLAAGWGALTAAAWWWRRREPVATLGRRLLLMGGACALVAAPWIATLSLKYGRFTFSTSARAAHAVVGPKDQDRYHPFARQLYHPEPGRITAWEDPTSLPYATWSPFASARNFRHQLGVIARNIGTAGYLLGSFDLLHLGVLSAVLWGVLGGVGKIRKPGAGGPKESRKPKAESRKENGAARGAAPREEDGDWEPWVGGVATLLLAGLAGVYLPGYLERVDQRYFYAALPLLFAATVAGASLLRRWLVGRAALVARLAGSVVAISFATPILLNAALALPGLPHPAAIVARELAAGIRATKRPGPVAGSGLLAGNRVGLFVAWFLEQPWYGDRPRATPGDFAAIGARWVLVRARRPVAAQLAADPRFSERTRGILGARFPDVPPEQLPLRLFERRDCPPPRPAPSDAARGGEQF